MNANYAHPDSGEKIERETSLRKVNEMHQSFQR